MNKLHTIVLATTLCSTMHDLTASEGQQRVFFDQQTKENFRVSARDYGIGYGISWALISTHSIGNILIHQKEDQSLWHRKWIFMPEEYGKHLNGSSKLMNIAKDQVVIGKYLLKTLPIALVAAFIYDGYQKSLDRQ